VQWVICHIFNGVSLLTVWGIPAQVKLATTTCGTGGWLQYWRLGHCPAAPCQVYHRGTLRFPPRIPLRRLRLWKINVRTPVPGSPATARVAKPQYGGYSARSVPGGTLASRAGPGTRGTIRAHYVDRPVDNERGH
jgi:hypothetical protein